MKLILLPILALTLAGVHSSEVLPDQVYNELQSYARQQVSSLRMMRGGPSVQCYDQYIPQITTIATGGKTDTETCISRADMQKDDALTKVKDKRDELDAAVKALQDSFAACISKTDVVEYMRCLSSATAANQAAFATIESTSASLTENLDNSYKTIEAAENTCIGAIITKAKQDTDQIFEALQLCLINGFDIPQEDPQPEQPQTDPQPDPQPEDPQLEVQPDPQPEEPQSETQVDPQPEQPQPEEPQSEPQADPQPEQPQPEEPQSEPQVDPQPEQPQPEEPQSEPQVDPQPEQPQPEEPQSEPQVDPQPEEPQSEPQVDPQPEQPQPEEPQSEPQVDPQPEEPQSEPQIDPQPEEPQPEQPQPEEPQPEEPQSEPQAEPQPEEPQPEQPQPEEPQSEPQAEQPQVEDPTVNQPELDEYPEADI